MGSASGGYRSSSACDPLVIEITKEVLSHVDIEFGVFPTECSASLVEFDEEVQDLVRGCLVRESGDTESDGFLGVGFGISHAESVRDLFDLCFARGRNERKDKLEIVGHDEASESRVGMFVGIVHVDGLRCVSYVILIKVQ